MQAHSITAAELDALKPFDTCILSDAIERLGGRLRNCGYTLPGLRQLTGDSELVVGYAATARVRSSEPPVVGTAYVPNLDWWPEIDRLDQPRVVVLEDLDSHPAGACIGQSSAALFKALACAGVVTNGAVRDLAAISSMALPLFAGYLCSSHAYSHIVSHGQPVEIFGLTIKWGDLIAADVHGAILIPVETVPDLPKVAAEILKEKREFTEFCLSSSFSLEKLEGEIARLKH